MSNVTATALQLDAPATLHRFLRSVTTDAPERGTLSLYEHRNNLYSLHGPADVALAMRLNVDDFRAISELPSCPPATDAPLQTLYFNARVARDVATAALFTAGKKVRVCAVGADGRAVTRCEGSPGNLASLEDSFLDSVGIPGVQVAGSVVLDDGAVLAVHFGSSRGMMQMGVCAWDGSRRSLLVSELYEDDVFSNLESMIVATNAKEAIFCQTDLSEFDKGKLLDVIEKCGVAMTLKERKHFSTSNVEVDLERLVGSHLHIAAYLDKAVAMPAAGALLDYMNLMVDPNLEGKVKIGELTCKTYMQLDNAAMRALNILPFPGDGGKTGSLFGLLNRAKGAMGSRLLRRWLSQPLQSIDEINARLDITSAFVHGADCRRVVRETHLNKLPDINLLCRRFTKNNGAKASLQDVVRLYQCSVRLPFLNEALESLGSSSVSERFAKPLKTLVKELGNFEALVETTIDLDQIDNGEFVVSPAVDPELQHLRKKQDGIIAEIDDEYAAVQSSIKGLKPETLKLERKDNLGYVFRLTRKDEKLIRGKTQLTILETRKDGVRFQNRVLRRLSESYQAISEEYSSKEHEMRAKTLEVAGTYVEVFLDIAAILAEVDVLCAFATVACESRSSYIRPTLLPSGSGLVLKQARHPIVEENMEDGVEFIANDLDLSRKSEQEEGEDKGGSLLLVTGPNMGGKSTYIRSAGVLTLMAHVGAYVPAAEAAIPITDRIFARVGAGDNQHRAISTFMSEMLETAAILRSASPKSLVIIDELGRGTGTTDGYGLAYAISKHIVTKIRSACLFATHFFELTALADDVSAVENVHVSAVADSKSSKLTFLYEVQPGACDQSFGVHVAEMANFPPKVVEAAKRKAAELEDYGAPSKKIKNGVATDEEKAEGIKLISDFLDKVRKLPLATDKEAEVSIGKVRAMQQEVLAKNNPYIGALSAE